MEKYRNYFLCGILSISTLFFVVYVFSSCFRDLLSASKMDPNFLVAFISTIGLLTSIISIKKERKFNFNLHLKKSVEDKAALVVGKLFTVMNNAEACYKAILNIKHCIDTGKKFIDTNNLVSLSESFTKDRDLLGAYIEIYFKPYIFQDWNDMQEKINKIATNSLMVIENYNQNVDLIDTRNFHNETLSNIDTILKESENLNKEIYELTEKMKESLLGILSENDETIRDKYIN